ncbi:hypothetical protein G5S37_01230 [Roseimicrobium sp. ORNL1]|nr:hypothetical protein G5S37_01230 [Roseimicrobium sp. ORNL1]
MASLRAEHDASWTADAENAGYVCVGTHRRKIHVPFHLVPALPDLPILEEAIQLSEQICLGAVGKNKAMICLSGSTLLLGDVCRNGDIDFCEYIPPEVDAETLAKSFQKQIKSAPSKHYVLGVRTNAQTGETFGELKFWRYKPKDVSSEYEQKCAVRLFAAARNAKTTHLMATQFSGVTEVTNWVIILQERVERDPASRLSFAHQEAGLGLYSKRPLHTLEALATYLNFLRNEIERYAEVNPVKAVKRAVPWLRLYGAGDLLDELLSIVRNHRAADCAAALSKFELLTEYLKIENVHPALGRLLERLRIEAQELADELIGYSAQDPQLALQEKLRKFGHALAATKPGKNSASILDKILALAPP